MSQHSKIENIQALRGVAVLGVILVHLSKIEEKFFHGNTILPGFLHIGTSGVDLFFVISGFLMVAITRGLFQNRSELYGFLYNRTTRIYPLYWFYSLLVLMVFLIRPGMVNSSQGHVNIIASFLLLPQDVSPLIMVGWTLVHEMYFYLVFAVLLLFPERWLLPLLIIWGVVATGIVPELASTGNPFITVATSPFILEFIAGCVIAYTYFIKKYNSTVLYYFIIVSLVWWLVGYGIFVAETHELELRNVWIRILIFGIPATLAVFSLVNIEREMGQKLPNWLILIGNASFSIYLSHFLVISALGRIWGSGSIKNPWMNFTALLTIFLSAIAIGILSYQRLERPLLRFTRRFEKVVVGNKNA